MVKGAYLFHRHSCLGESEMRGVEDREFMCGHGTLIW